MTEAGLEQHTPTQDEVIMLGRPALSYDPMTQTGTGMMVLAPKDTFPPSGLCPDFS
jgi:hypothetical protein